MARKTSNKASDKPQSAMAALLAKHQDKFVALKKGESVKGKITKIDKHDILVDLGTKTEAHVMEKDANNLRTILDMFKVGDTVDVNVLNPESDYGYPVVSLRRYLGRIAWDKLEKLLKSQDQIEATIVDTGKAGLVLSTSFGISGFLPNSHTANLQNPGVGQKINVSVFELSKSDNKIIFSQKINITNEEFDKIAKKFKIGDKVKATISNVTQFGIFVSLENVAGVKSDNIEGFIHISEVAWEKVDDLEDMFDQGQEIEAAVKSVDRDTKKISLSIKRLTGDPFEKQMEEFPVDKKVAATVLSVDSAGVTVDLGNGAEGFIKKEKIPPTMTFAVDQDVQVTIAEHDKRRHRIIVAPVLKEKPLGYR